MAFWGVEVKPGKPYTHTYQADHGRLRICQATLGNCDATARTVLQCNVGNKIPIKLCSLNPKLAETYHLEIEFEEVDDVVFSVLGHSSIHLSGYYVRASSRSNVGDDESESYGEDIQHSDTDEEHDASEDSYESDFIDDREVPLSEKSGSDSIDDSDYESTLRRHRKQKAVEKPTRKAERRRRLKKQQVDSTDENGDDTPVTKPVVKRNAKIFDSADDDTPVKMPVVKRNAKIFDSGDDDTPVKKPVDKRSASPVFDDSGDDEAPVKKPVDKRSSASVFDDSGDDETPVKKPGDKRSAASVFDDSGDDETPVKKPVDKRSAASVFDDSGDDETPVKKPVDKRSAASVFDSGSDEDDNVPISVALGKKDKAKVAEETDPRNGQANDVTKQKIIDVKKRKHSAISEDPALSMDTTDANATSVSEQGDEMKKKSKKKKKKNQSGEKDEKQSNIRTLEDGLMVEDLSIGNIDAKVASDGCKVYIKYVGMLKNGKIVQSNVSEKPYKFKLGAGKVIRGWDVGIRGMRVGEKRKLTVPPSMLSGGKSMGEVPENSSVIYEIELVKVK